ncbi:MAG TPA: HD domain-containing phosphohydrolase [Solirubrobacteraceae bacterium]|jgi:diguanylate cyclase (GGDEF)-like protein|nr:HD domain-containing phosphohydrolase [Solirubrobacteraceae bacterium]
MSASWLCPTDQDRRRVLEASPRVLVIRKVGSGAVGVTLLISAPWLGWWTLILFGCSALNFLSVDRRMARSSHPERVSVSAILITLVLLASGVALSGGPSSPALPWLVLPAGMAAARFRPQVVTAGLALTVACILAVTVGVYPSATLHDPVPVFTTLALLTAVVSIVWALQSAEMHQRSEATVDPLTGLANRRQLAQDLDGAWAQASEEHPLRLLLFDLDGFKSYNDNFGHLGGDLLLSRLAQAFKRTIGSAGCAYRLGGDEFCALLWADSGEAMVGDCLHALSTEGDGFKITSSYGSVMLPTEANDPQVALQLADERMYAHKDSSRASAGRQTRDLALQILAAHEPELHSHAAHVAELTDGVARRLGLKGHDLSDAVRAAELHDIGKVAIPYSLLHKAGPLDEHEWEMMRHHPIVGASILGAAPALARVAELVGATHERYDGTGYPRGLIGRQIPRASQIVFVCDSFDAMTSARPYGEAKSEADALGELRRCAGTQFDPRVVDAFVAEHAARRALATTGQPSPATGLPPAR